MKTVIVSDLMQKNYQYTLSEPVGENFHPDFTPELTPPEMLFLGVFGGKYMTDCKGEFPAEWFKNVKLCHEKYLPEYNFFGVNASQSLSEWRKKRLDLPRRSEGLVSVVLPLLHGTKMSR